MLSISAIGAQSAPQKLGQTNLIRPNSKIGCDKVSFSGGRQSLVETQSAMLEELLSCGIGRLFGRRPKVNNRFACNEFSVDKYFSTAEKAASFAYRRIQANVARLKKEIAKFDDESQLETFLTKVYGLSSVVAHRAENFGIDAKGHYLHGCATNDSGGDYFLEIALAKTEGRFHYGWDDISPKMQAILKQKFEEGNGGFRLGDFIVTEKNGAIRVTRDTGEFTKDPDLKHIKKDI